MNYRKYAIELWVRLKDKYKLWLMRELDRRSIIDCVDMLIIVEGDKEHTKNIRVSFPLNEEDRTWIMFEMHGEDRDLDHVVRWIDKVYEIAKPLLLSAKL